MTLLGKGVKYEVDCIRMLNVNRLLLNVIVGLVIHIVVSTTAAEAETISGINEVFMFDEKLQEFKSTGICYLLEPGSSFMHKKFKLTRNGPMYDLCYAGSYVSGINDGKVLCKPCPDNTYNPFMNACPYCLVCRTCGQNQHEVTTCTRKSDRTCQCALGRSCPPGYPNEVIIRPTHISTRTENTTEQNVNTLFSNTRSDTSHDTETNWKTLFIVAGCLVYVLIVVIYLLWRSLQRKPKMYQPVKTDDLSNGQNQPESRTVTTTVCQPVRTEQIQMDDLSNGQNQPENRTVTTRDIDDDDIRRLIEELSKKISKDYKEIGINLKISEDELNRILQDNQGRFIDAIRTMLNEARKRNGSGTRHVFMEAFEKSDRTDLAEIVQEDIDITRLIKELAENISKDYNKIGIALNISEDKLNRIWPDNQGRFIDAIREMLNTARGQNGSRTHDVFKEAFKKNGRTDLAEIVQTDLDKIARKRSSASTALVEVHAHSSPV